EQAPARTQERIALILDAGNALEARGIEHAHTPGPAAGAEPKESLRGPDVEPPLVPHHLVSGALKPAAGSGLGERGRHVHAQDAVVQGEPEPALLVRHRSEHEI